MGLVWKKRKGRWYLISDIYKKLLTEETIEITQEDGSITTETQEIRKYENNGVLWFKHNGEWIDIFNPEKDFITTGDPEHDTIDSIEDGDMVELKYRNIYVKRGHTLTLSNRCKGMLLNLTGDLVVYGTISMTARGAAAEGRYVGIDYVNNKVTISNDAETNPFLANTFKVSFDSTNCDKCGLCYDVCNYEAIILDKTETTDEETGEITVTINNVSLDTEKCIHCGVCVDICIEHGINAFTKTYNIIDNHYVISPVGGLGNTNAVGGNGVNGACGAGGGGVYVLGGNGTSFSGGSGAGGATYYYTAGGGSQYSAWNSGSTANTGGDNNGGPGGNGAYFNSYTNYGGGGGAGNPVGTAPYYSNNGENGTGGLLIALVSGNIVFGDTGSIVSNGCRGGNVTSYYHYKGSGRYQVPHYYHGGQGGAGSGGGAIHIFYNGTINVDNDSISTYIMCKGGSGGTSVYGSVGVKGGDGFVHLAKVTPEGKLQYSNNLE